MASNSARDQGSGRSQKTDAQAGSKGTAKRGFAAMDEETQRSIASKGGQAAHQKGTAHEFDSEEARRAGQKGGEAVSRDREHMAQIGRKGGESRQSAARANAESKKQAAAGSTRGGGSEQVSKGASQHSGESSDS